MASKNARRGIVAQKNFCSCGGEVKIKSVFKNGKLKQYAYCTECNRIERRPKDFK